MQWMIWLFLLGVSFTLWTLIGVLRLVSERRDRTVADFAATEGGERDAAGRLSAADVAVLIPAHDEETGIRTTVASVAGHVPKANIHVVADGCADRTAELARACGVNVLTLHPCRGKAGGIEAALRHFDLECKFAVLLIVDADTELDEHYVERGLRMLDDPEMVALAGYAQASWRPHELPLVGRFLVAYRARLYTVMQWMKYGQTWRYANVTAIVPGFASMYRTAVLPRMELNPPGLVIEDFNMTFELHRRRLGKIAFRPAVFAKTQDPDNLPDYYRQVKRWWLGFWQTVRRHKLWPSWFSVVLGFFLVEVLLASVAIIVIALAIVLLALPPLTGGAVLGWQPFAEFDSSAGAYFTPLNLLVFLFLPDYLLTCCVAIWTRRPSMLVYGVGFLPIRLIDATATLWTLPQAWRARSTGQWVSPARRALQDAKAPPEAPAGGQARPSVAPGSAAEPSASTSTREMPPAAGPSDVFRARTPIFFDAVTLGNLLVLTAAVVVAFALPILPVLGIAILSVAFGAAWSHRSRLADPRLTGFPGWQQRRERTPAGGRRPTRPAGLCVPTLAAIGSYSPCWPPSSSWPAVPRSSRERITGPVSAPHRSTRRGVRSSATCPTGTSSVPSPSYARTSGSSTRSARCGTPSTKPATWSSPTTSTPRSIRVKCTSCRTAASASSRPSPTCATASGRPKPSRRSCTIPRSGRRTSATSSIWPCARDTTAWTSTTRACSPETARSIPRSSVSWGPRCAPRARCSRRQCIRNSPNRAPTSTTRRRTTARSGRRPTRSA